ALVQLHETKPEMALQKRRLRGRNCLVDLLCVISASPKLQQSAQIVSDDGVAGLCSCRLCCRLYQLQCLVKVACHAVENGHVVDVLRSEEQGLCWRAAAVRLCWHAVDPGCQLSCLVVCS